MRFFLKKNGALPPPPGQLTTPMKLMVAIGPPHGMAVFNIYIYILSNNFATDNISNLMLE